MDYIDKFCFECGRHENPFIKDRYLLSNSEKFSDYITHEEEYFNLHEECASYFKYRYVGE